MPRVVRPVFLERRSYRRRRLIDAVRLVAVVGVVLWMMPVIWPNGSGEAGDPVSMSQALFYVFGVWSALIVLCAFLALRLRDGRSDDVARETDAAAKRTAGQ